MIRSTLIFVAAVAVFLADPVHAQDAAVAVEVEAEGAAAPQDVFIVDEPEQPQPNTQPQPNAQAQPVPPAPTAAPVYAQPYQQPQAQQPAYAPQPFQGRRLRAPYIEGAPMPPGGVLIERRRLGMIISGAAMFGASYIITALTASAIEEGALAIPLVGPLLYMDRTVRAGDIGLVLDSLVQTGGLTLLILGIVLKKKYVEYYAEGGQDRQWSLLPQVGTTSGLQLDLRF